MNVVIVYSQLFAAVYLLLWMPATLNIASGAPLWSRFMWRMLPIMIGLGCLFSFLKSVGWV